MASLLGSLNLIFRRRKFVINISDGRRNISKVGFIGLGNMGKHMAKNLLQKGFNVTVYDINKEASKTLSYDGAKVAISLEEVASDADCVITMLPNNETVFEMYSKSNGIINNSKKGTVLIDSSTVDPKIPKQLNSLASNKGISLLDCPVSGGVIAAHSGQLTFMVGGSEESVKLVDHLLLAMGRNIIYCGPIGSGQVAKICNNLVMAISMAGLSEAMNIGIRLGLDAKTLTSIINTSSGRCWSSEIYNPVPGVLENVPSSKNYQGGFGTKLLVKDLNLARDIAEQSSSPNPLGNITLKLFSILADSGHADNDFSIIYEFLKNNNSVNV